jgi:uncharacterized membrane protein
MQNRKNTIDRVEYLNSRGYRMQTMVYFTQAVELIKRYWAPFAVYTLIYMAFLLLVYRLGENGSFLQFILSGPLNAGYYLAIHRLVNGKPFQFENFFDGFRIMLPVMTVAMAAMFLTSLGVMLFVLPGLIISLSLIFALPLVIFGQLELFSALRSSTQVVWKQFWEMAKFGLFIILLNVTGALMLGVGLLFTVPLTFAAIYFAYVDIIGIGTEKDTEKSEPDLNHFR